MAGSISTKDKLRIYNIVERGYYNSQQDFDALFRLIGISQFMPNDKQFVKEVFKRYYTYYDNIFIECLTNCLTKEDIIKLNKRIENASEIN